MLNNIDHDLKKRIITYHGPARGYPPIARNMMFHGYDPATRTRSPLNSKIVTLGLVKGVWTDKELEIIDREELVRRLIRSYYNSCNGHPDLISHEIHREMGIFYGLDPTNVRKHMKEIGLGPIPRLPVRDCGPNYSRLDLLRTGKQVSKEIRKRFELSEVVN